MTSYTEIVECKQNAMCETTEKTQAAQKGFNSYLMSQKYLAILVADQPDCVGESAIGLIVSGGLSLRGRLFFLQ